MNNSRKYADKPPYPNNCPSADAMASVLLHEVAEAASNLLGRCILLYICKHTCTHTHMHVCVCIHAYMRTACRYMLHIRAGG